MDCRIWLKIRISKYSYVLFKDPCEKGYEYKKGTRDGNDQLGDEREQVDNQKCASLCSKNASCSSYEHTRYDNVCKLFKRDGVVNDGRSGYIHCDRLGIG